jgi:hypothetical protein
MSVDVDCPTCGAMLPVPVRLVDPGPPPTYEPDYSGAQAHVEAHDHMSIRRGES